MAIGPDALAAHEVSTNRPLALFWRRLRSDKVALSAAAFKHLTRLTVMVVSASITVAMFAEVAAAGLRLK